MSGLGLFQRAAMVTAATLVIPVGAAIAAPSGSGAPGIGDPYYPDYGNGGYDVSHYDVAVAYNPTGDSLTGSTLVTARTKQRLSTFDLDFMLPVSSVKVNGKPATYTQQNHELVVTPKDTLASGAPMEVLVRYAGVPSDYSDDGISPWIKTSDGAAAVGEPEIAAWWYPSNDHPRDKATYDVKVTVAKSLEALGNGKLVSKKVSNGRRTWHWREAKPMAPYLAFFVVGQFDITRSTTKSGLPVITAVASDGGSEGQYAAADLKRTPEVISWESRQWGKYPFEAMGGVAPKADFGFALENQTRPVYTRGFWRTGSNIYVIVHELAHQWYGDSVSVRNWKDIWLNEGFASFTEWLWSEKHGEGSAKKLFAQTYDQYPESSSFWTLRIGDPGAGHEFSGAVYDRGAMTLQALRTRIGSPAFYTTMRNWASDHKYGNGSITQFIRLAEKVSGKKLDGFFDAWLFTPTRPAATKANGFPAGFGSAGSTTREAPPASWSKLRAARDLLLGAERR
jgi:aminopeptidase N